MGKNKTENKAQVRYSGAVLRHWYWSVLMTLFLLVLTAGVLYIDTLAGVIVGVFSLFLFLTFLLLELYYRPKVLQELVDFAHRFSGVEKAILQELAVPYGIVQSDGRVLWMNDNMMQLCGKGENYHKSISALFPQIQVTAFPTEGEAENIAIEYEQRKYRVEMRKIYLDELMAEYTGAEAVSDECYVLGLYFFDETELLALKQENYEEKPVIGLVYIDNYEEAMESVDEMRRSMLEALVDRRITKYISSIGGLIKKTEKGKYLFVINRKTLEPLEKDHFSVVEDVKTVNIGNAISVTISIGIGLNCGDYAQNCEAARIAIEMALARGGDQAVVKDRDKMSFFGGKSQRSERNTRVRARVKAQALRELIAAHDRVIVMGHKITDVDSLGASVGICRAAMQVGKPAYIVLGDVNAGIRPWIEKMKNCEGYDSSLFLTHEQAVEMTNYSTVVVVVDTNRPSMAECEEILYLTRSIVVLDHHRQGTEKIEHASLSYIEPNASSSCEMVAEILQYYDDSIRLKQEEADCIYAGIIIDTDSFVTKTGMRTFEAAAFLRRCGADMTRVRKAFRNDMDTYKARAEAVRNAETFMGSYAISVCPVQGIENPTVVGAQAANELLNIIGVKASFVLTEFNNRIYISARAIDEVNVQIIMEQLGGGGHMTCAGAQLEGIDTEGARVKLKEVLTMMTRDGSL